MKYILSIIIPTVQVRKRKLEDYKLLAEGPTASTQTTLTHLCIYAKPLM